MVEIGYSPLVPTVFDGNMLQIHSKYWWLRSPITNWNGIAFLCHPVRWLRRQYRRLRRQPFLRAISFLVVLNRRARTAPSACVLSSLLVTSSTTATTMSTIPTGAHHLAGHELLLQRLASQPFWWRRLLRLRQRLCLRFLRARIRRTGLFPTVCTMFICPETSTTATSGSTIPTGFIRINLSIITEK